MYVYIRVYVYIYIYIYTRVCMYIYIYIYICTHTHNVYIYIYVLMIIIIIILICVCICMYTVQTGWVGWAVSRHTPLREFFMGLLFNNSQVINSDENSQEMLRRKRAWRTLCCSILYENPLSVPAIRERSKQGDPPDTRPLEDLDGKNDGRCWPCPWDF